MNIPFKIGKNTYNVDRIINHMISDIDLQSSSKQSVKEIIQQFHLTHDYKLKYLYHELVVELVDYFLEDQHENFENQLYVIKSELEKLSIKA